MQSSAQVVITLADFAFAYNRGGGLTLGMRLLTAGGEWRMIGVFRPVLSPGGRLDAFMARLEAKVPQPESGILKP